MAMLVNKDDFSLPLVVTRLILSPPSGSLDSPTLECALIPPTCDKWIFMPSLNFFSQLPSFFILLPATLRDDPYLFGTGVETSACTIRLLEIVQTFCTA